MGRLSKTDRALLENQRAIMFALVTRSPINRAMLRARIEITSALTVPNPPKKRRKPASRKGAFANDIGDQGYRPLKMPTRP